MKAETWLPILPLAQVEWGTVPDWLAAVGTLLAFAVALRLLFKELAARREVEEDRRREQARLVSAWTLRDQFQTGFGTYELGFAVKVRNASQEPVYDLKFTLVPYEGPFATDPEAARRADETVETGTEGGDLGRLPPGETIRFRIKQRPHLESLVLGLSFTDSQGRRWKRLPNGTLTEITKRPRRSRKDYMNAWIAGELDHLDY
jgi:hypothetical protein